MDESAALIESPRLVRKRRTLLGALALGVVLGAGGAGLGEVARVVVGTNRHTVLAGRIYRSAQLDGAKLREVIAKEGIRTVVNLRGVCREFDWYVEEARATHDLGVSQEDVTLSANRFPPMQEIRRVVEILDRTEYPILIHCRRGSDRTGLVTAVAMLLHTDGGLPAARAQLSVRQGHLRALGTARMDEFFDAYEAWLTKGGAKHAPDRFRHWLLNEYTPGPAHGVMTLLNPTAAYKVGEAPKLQVRALNRSSEVWYLKAATGAGVHIRFILFPPAGPPLLDARAGYFERSVPPGEAVDFTIGLPHLPYAGRYRVLFDLVGPRDMSFMQAGSKPLEMEFDVRE